MEVNTILWISGIAVVVVVGSLALRGKKREEDTTKNVYSPKELEGKRVQRPEPKRIQSGDTRPAEVAFLENLNKFIPLLPGLDNGMISKQKWTEAIVGINNIQLTEYWQAMVDKPDLAKQWLSLFLEPCGIKYEACDSFVAMSAHKELYDSEDGSQLTNGLEYYVISHCWILTEEDDNGNVKQTVIRKGVVKPL